MTEHLHTKCNWDVRSALANVDGHVSELKYLLEVWLRQIPQFNSEIRLGIENRDGKRIQLAAHTLIGSLQILCAEEFCPAAVSLEDAGRSGQTSDVHVLFDQLESQLASLSGRAADFLAEN
jgi:HPt (histidine-containing phosphotransfer) domain-containing protein